MVYTEIMVTLTFVCSLMTMLFMAVAMTDNYKAPPMTPEAKRMYS